MKTIEPKDKIIYCLYISLWLAIEEDNDYLISHIKHHLQTFNLPTNPEFDTDGVPTHKDLEIDPEAYFEYNDKYQDELNEFWKFIQFQIFPKFDGMVKIAPNLLALKQLLYEEFRNSTTKEFSDFNSLIKKYEGQIKYGWKMGIDEMGEAWFSKAN